MIQRILYSVILFLVLVAVMFVTCNRHADSILHLSANKP